MSLYVKYKDVKTAQDLIDRNYVPKTSSASLKIIAGMRLDAVRDSILSQVDERMFGQWLPAFAPVLAEDERPVSSLDEIVKLAAAGLKVTGNAISPGGERRQYSGTVRLVGIDSDYVGVEWESEVRGGSNLEGYAEDGHGEILYYNNLQGRGLQLFVKGVIDHYALAQNVVADKQLGHKVMFNQQYSGALFDSNGNRLTGQLPAGLHARLVEYNESRGIAHIAFDDSIEGFGSRKNFIISAKDAAGSLVVSSLGQIEPKNLEQEVYNQSLLDFFPYTVLDTETARKTLVAILMERHMVFYGPPGAGKSELASDIAHIRRQQEVIFHIKDCKVQCSPFSLLDGEFAKNVQPCPECQINYDTNKDDPAESFKSTGRFFPPEPSSIKVIVAEFGNAKGVELLGGSSDVRGMHLTGFKLPRLDGSPAEMGSQFDPEGFSPGILSRTNNGLLILEDMQELQPPVMSHFLNLLEKGRVEPDQLRFAYPAYSVVVGTTNDVSALPDRINDRLVLIPVNYPQDRDVSYSITRRAFYGERQDAASVEISDPHTAAPSILRSIPMPAIIDRAVDGFYILFRNEYNGEGKQEILGGNRSKLDARLAARAELLIDRKFFKGTPEIVTEEYAVKGILYAMLSRLQQQTNSEYAAAEKSITDFVAEKFPIVLQEEINTWWCRAYQSIAVKETQVPGITENFNAEIASYKSEQPKDPFDLFCRLKEASQDSGRLPFDAPFIAHLAEEQPLRGPISKPQFAALLGYFLKVQETAKCG